MYRFLNKIPHTRLLNSSLECNKKQQEPNYPVGHTQKGIQALWQDERSSNVLHTKWAASDEGATIY